MTTAGVPSLAQLGCGCLNIIPLTLIQSNWSLVSTKTHQPRPQSKQGRGGGHRLYILNILIMLTHLDIQWMIKATVFYYGSFNSDILHQHQPFIWLPLISYHYCMLAAWSVELVINCFVPLNKAKVSFGASVCWFLYLLLYSYCYCSYLCSIQSWAYIITIITWLGLDLASIENLQHSFLILCS